MGLSFAAQAHTPVRWYFNPRAPCGARPPRPCPLCPAGPYFNPRAPCGARRLGAAGEHQPLQISIHAPLAGRDGCQTVARWFPRSFQSTRPLRGATARQLPALSNVAISIHAPLAGRDSKTANLLIRVIVISIHAPLAGRDNRKTVGNGSCMRISIHAPLAGRDCGASIESLKPAIFQSTRPLRGATIRSWCLP